MFVSHFWNSLLQHKVQSFIISIYTSIGLREVRDCWIVRILKMGPIVRPEKSKWN